jgi:hypothetical protein
MLISMPTETSTIFGVFQAIWRSLLIPDELRPRRQGTADQEVRQLNLLRETLAGLCCIAKCAHAIVRPFRLKMAWDQAFRGCSHCRE